MEKSQFKKTAESHRAEVEATLAQISHLTGLASPRKYFPSRYSPFVWSKLSGGSVNDWCSCQAKVNHAIRQIHDFYGWMAKSGRRGVCKGTLYRTVKFMELETNQRDGSKKPTRNIHIEHTVPVDVLENFLSYESSRFKTPEELHGALISNSICVAMTHDEQKSLDRHQVPRSSNEAFSESGERIGDHPFRRYLPLLNSEQSQDFKIVNVITGDLVNLQTFTFKDHEDTLAKASKLRGEGDALNIYSLALFNSKDWHPAAV